ncbi:MAG: hypothetical protein WC215_02800 [Bacilli bacterium]
MKERCPTAKPVGQGYLDDWKLVFDGYSGKRQGLVADIRKKKDSKLPYVLWNIESEHEIAYLNEREGYAPNRSLECNSYVPMPINVQGFEEVFVYIMTETFRNKRGQSRTIPTSYIQTIREGYRCFNLNEDYLDQAIREAENG